MAFSLSRRSVLRGIGAGIALPVLDCMLDGNGLIMGEAKAQAAAPLRFLSFFYNNGVPQEFWHPKDSNGTTFSLNEATQALDGLKPFLNQITGLNGNHLNAFFAHTDGQLGFLSGTAPFTDTKNGAATSIEWLLGNELGKTTAFPALALSLPWGRSDRGRGNQNSWLGPNNPATVIDKPYVLWEKLTGVKVDANQQVKQNSVLDFISAEAKRLQAKVGAADKQRLDQHLTAIKEIEQQIKASGSSQCAPYSGGTPPQGDPGDEAAMKAMAKLIVFAFQCDLTRYISFGVACAPPFNPNSVDGNMNDHATSHVVAGTEYRDNIKYHDLKMKYWVSILQGLKDSNEGGQSILYNMLSLSGTDVSWEKNLGSDNHCFKNLPLMLMGNAGGKIKSNRHIDGSKLATSDQTYNNLMLGIVNALGSKATKFGSNSTKILPGLMG